MNPNLKKFFRHSLVYGLGSAIGAVGGFILIPVYTKVLSPSEYGSLDLLNRIADLLVLVKLMGMRQAYIRFFFDREDEGWRRRVTGNVVLFALASSIFFSLCAYFLRHFITATVFSKGGVGDIVYVFTLMLIWIPVDLQVNLGLTYLQIRMKSTAYVSVNFIRFLLFISSNIVLVYYMRKGIAGIFWTQIWTTVFISAGLLFYVWRKATFVLDFGLIKQLLKFGLPYLPAAFFMYLINNGDRYILGMSSTFSALGIYALAFKIGMMGTVLLMDPLQKVWGPFLFENYSKPGSAYLFGRIFTLFVLANATVALAISSLAPVIIPLISGKDFHSAYKVVPLIALASVFMGLSDISDAGILIAKRTDLKPMIFGITAAISILLNLVLVPRYAEFGAASALVCSSLAICLLNYNFSSRYFRFQLEHRKIFLIFASCAITYFASRYGSSVGTGLLWREVFSISALLIFPLMLWTMGFFSRDEKLMIKGFLSGNPWSAQAEK
ncbi:MAG: oligosaccharide flippase family protein [Nitrospiraceae bacterium]|nr:oligosaccharide flippase family protein [Nitrospiraceae bacterium]